MSASACSFEAAVLRAVRLGFIEDEVREHTSSCGDCAELLEVAGLLDHDRREAIAAAKIPPAGALWLQMKLRAAREGRVRPLRAARLIQGGSIAAALVIALTTLGLPTFPPVSISIPTFATPWAIPLLTASAVFALIAPLAVWVSVARR